MDKTTMNLFINAIKTAEIDTYSLVTDMTTHLYNNTVDSIIVIDDGNEIAYSIRSNNNYGSAQYFENSELLAIGAKFEDIHEVRTGADYATMVKFIEALGITLEQDQLDILLKAAKGRSPLHPITGDYQFKKLTDEEYEKLTPEEKEVYDKALKQFELKKMGLSKSPVVIDSGYITSSYPSKDSSEKIKNTTTVVNKETTEEVPSEDENNASDEDENE